MPTAQPTPEGPTLAPTSEGSNPLQSVVQLSGEQVISNLPADASVTDMFSSGSDGGTAFTNAVAQVVNTDGVTANDVSITGVTEIASNVDDDGVSAFSRSMLAQPIVVSSSTKSVSIAFFIQFTAIGGASMATSKFNELSAALTLAVGNGTLTRTLQSLAHTLNVSDLMDVTADTAPTLASSPKFLGMNTVTPTESPTVSSGASSTAANAGLTTVDYVVGGCISLCCLLVCMCGVLYAAFKRNTLLTTQTRPRTWKTDETEASNNLNIWPVFRSMCLSSAAMCVSVFFAVCLWQLPDNVTLETHKDARIVLTVFAVFIVCTRVVYWMMNVRYLSALANNSDTDGQTWAAHTDLVAAMICLLCLCSESIVLLPIHNTDVHAANACLMTIFRSICTCVSAVVAVTVLHSTFTNEYAAVGYVGYICIVSCMCECVSACVGYKTYKARSVVIDAKASKLAHAQIQRQQTPPQTPVQQAHVRPGQYVSMIGSPPPSPRGVRSPTSPNQTRTPVQFSDVGVTSPPRRASVTAAQSPPRGRSSLVSTNNPSRASMYAPVNSPPADEASADDGDISSAPQSPRKSVAQLRRPSPAKHVKAGSEDRRSLPGESDHRGKMSNLVQLGSPTSLPEMKRQSKGEVQQTRRTTVAGVPATARVASANSVRVSLTPSSGPSLAAKPSGAETEKKSKRNFNLDAL